MKNREYFIEEDGLQVGPLSIEQLKEKQPSQETLVWFESLSEWTEIGEIPELNDLVKIKIEKASFPPPLPKMKSEKVNSRRTKMFESAESKLFFALWIGIHLFALVTSYSEIDIFNSSSPDTDDFWPFVNFTYELNDYWGKHISTSFLGIFHEYDWSEFAVYVGGAFLLYLVFSLVGDIETQKTEES